MCRSRTSARVLGWCVAALAVGCGPSTHGGSATGNSSASDSSGSGGASATSTDGGVPDISWAIGRFYSSPDPGQVLGVGHYYSLEVRADGTATITQYICREPPDEYLVQTWVQPWTAASADALEFPPSAPGDEARFGGSSPSGGSAIFFERGPEDGLPRVTQPSGTQAGYMPFTEYRPGVACPIFGAEPPSCSENWLLMPCE